MVPTHLDRPGPQAAPRNLSRFWVAAALAAGLLVHSRDAAAQAQDRNNFLTPTFDLQLWRPAMDSRGYVTVNASQTLGHLEFSLGLVGTWAFQPLQLQLDAGTAYPGSVAAVQNTRQFSVDHLITPQLQFAIGLFKYIEIGVGIPVGIVIGQRKLCQGGDTGNCSGYTDNASPPTTDQLRFSDVTLGDIAVHIKGRILDISKFPVGLAAMLSVYVPVSMLANNSGYKDFLAESNVTLRPQLILDREWDRNRRFRTSINVGALVRFASSTFTDIGKSVAFMGNDICFPSDPVTQLGPMVKCDPAGTTRGGTGLSRSLGTQITYGLGLSFAVVPQRFDILAEVYGYADVTGQEKALPLEASGALKLYLARNSYFLVGAGAGIYGNGGEQTGSPRVRAFLGFIYEPHIGDRDGDGIKDNVDQCPDEPEDMDGFEDQDGCPDPDNDKDGVVDSRDRCPNVPGPPENNGCPIDADRDGDGIPDSKDKCPDDPEDRDGFEDDDGCPELDNDKDGIPDNDDKCPNEPETKNGFQDEDGCPDGQDRDRDGIPDELDKCPDQAEDKDGFEDEDGCPDPDNDKDRIPDKFDKCPNEPETYNGIEDEDGCPDAEKGRVMVTSGKILILDKVYFETGKAAIKPVSFPLLDQVGATLKGNPQIELIEIQGHADERGNDDANLRLTQARTQSVKEYLEKKGVEGGRMVAKGYGETRPVCQQHNETCWEKNRRVEFVILKPAPAEGAVGSDSAANKQVDIPTKKHKKKHK